MPELPEVETMVRGVRESLRGRVIGDFLECPCTCRPLTVKPPFSAIRPRICGQRITDVSRLAKRIVILLGSGDRIVIEPRMTGLLLLADPPDPEHLRFEWRLRGRRGPGAFWFWDRRGLGTLTLFSPEEWDAWRAGPGPGIDALEMSPAAWREQLARTRRAVKVALLDQQLVAGIGNLYASEILHVSRIHPETPAASLSRAQVGQLSAATADVLHEAIRHEGSTLSDGTYRNALNKAGGYQNAHRVYDREGEQCPTCRRGRIRRIVQAQRSTFYCPVCQRAPRG